MDWTKQKASRLVTNIDEYTAELPDGYGLQVHRYKSYVSGNFVNEWGVWSGNKVVDFGIDYGSLQDGKTAAEEALSRIRVED